MKQKWLLLIPLTALGLLIAAVGPTSNFFRIDALISHGAYNATMHTFTRSPSNSVTGTQASTVTFSAAQGGCPVGVAGADSGHYLYASGGTGTAEAVLITGGTCTSGAASGTIVFTPANSHSGAWSLTSASGGIQEAALASASSHRVHLAPGTYTVRHSFTLPSTVQVQFDHGALLTTTHPTSASDTTADTVTFNSPSHVVAQPSQQIFNGPGFIAWTNPGAVYSAWWGSHSEYLAQAPSAPTVAESAGSSNLYHAYTAGHRYYFMQTCVAWGGETGGPNTPAAVGPYTATANTKAFLVIPTARISTRCVGAKIYIKDADAGDTTFHLATNPIALSALWSFGDPGACCAVPINGGSYTEGGPMGTIAVYSASIVNPPADGTTTTDQDSTTVNPDTEIPNAPIVSVIENAATTYYVGYTYTGGDGTETQISSCATYALTTASARLVATIGATSAPVEPPSGALYVNWYVGTSDSTYPVCVTANMHYQFSSPLSLGQVIIAKYNSGGANPSFSAKPTSAVSPIQQAWDSLTKVACPASITTANAGELIINTNSTAVPLIFRDFPPACSSGAGILNAVMRGTGGLTATVTYTGSPAGKSNSNLVFAVFSLSDSRVEHVQFLDPNAVVRIGYGIADFAGGSAFNDDFVGGKMQALYTNADQRFNGVGVQMSAQSQVTAACGHNAASIAFHGTMITAYAWGFDVAGGQNGILRFQDTAVTVTGGTADSGDVRNTGTLGSVIVDNTRGLSYGEYGYFLSSDTVNTCGGITDSIQLRAPSYGGANSRFFIYESPLATGNAAIQIDSASWQTYGAGGTGYALFSGGNGQFHVTSSANTAFVVGNVWLQGANRSGVDKRGPCLIKNGFDFFGVGGAFKGSIDACYISTIGHYNVPITQPYTILAIDNGASFTNNVPNTAGTMGYTLPVPVVGESFTFTVSLNAVLTVTATGSAKIYSGSVASAGNGAIQSSTIGSQITLTAQDIGGTAHWVATASTDGWTLAGRPIPNVITEQFRNLVAVDADIIGTTTLSTGTKTITFAVSFTSAPVCIATDQTALNPVQAAPSNTAVVFTGTSSDVIAYHCFANPN